MALSDLTFLTADHVLWVHPDGDVGAPGTEADPVPTYQEAFDLASSTLYFNNKTVSLKPLRDPEDPPFVFQSLVDCCHVNRAWHGPGTLRIVGDVANPANVKLDAPNGSCVRTGGGFTPGLQLPGNLFVEGFEVTARDFGLRHAASCDVAIGHMRYGNCIGAHYGNEWASANIRTHGPCTVFGDTQQHVHCDVGTMMIMHPCTIIGSRTFQQFCDAQHNGYAMFIGTATFDLTNGSAVGYRYRSRTGARIQGKVAPWELPGSVAGAVETATNGAYFVA